MDLFDALPATVDAHALLPAAWTTDPALAKYSTLGDLETIIASDSHSSPCS